MGRADREKVRVLYVSMEDSGDLVIQRLRHVCAAYGLSPKAIERQMTVLDGTRSPPLFEDRGVSGGCVSPTPAFGQIRTTSQGMGLVIIDNASDAFDGNENDRRQVRAFMRALSSLARDTNSAVLLLAHVDKSAARFGASGNSYSGSTAWHNSARSRLALVDSAGGPELQHEKSNLGPAYRSIQLQFDESGVLTPATAETRTQALIQDAEMVGATLAGVLRSGTKVPVAKSGPTTTYRAIEKFLPPDFLSPQGRRRALAAITVLEQAGFIYQKEYKQNNRHPAKRWEQTQMTLADALANARSEDFSRALIPTPM